MAFSIRARVVFPVDRPPIEYGVVTIEGERIVEVGSASPGGELIDLGSVALLPGLVNAHTHLEFSHLRRPLGEPGMVLADWIRLVIAERGRDLSDATDSIAVGLRESAGNGVTTIGDIATAGTGDRRTQGMPDRTAFLEVIGFSRARAASAFAALGERLAAAGIEGGSRIGISPHAPYTVSPDLLRQLVQLARDRNMPVAMHVAESADELSFLADGAGRFQELLEERSMWDAEAIPHGSRPLDYLRMLADAPRALVIHGNYLDDEERGFLARHADRMSLVYCPRTHAYFCHAAYPLMEALKAGVRVALGTDSRASNPDLDLLAEMRYVAKTFPEVDPRDVLRMGTLCGAEALGCAGQVGSITPGKTANLIAVSLAEPLRDAANESLNHILNSDAAPLAIWLHGRR